MRRLEEVIMAKNEEPLYMAELSAQVGASYWILRDCCLEYLGMSPKRYLWLRRMHLARWALRSADGERTTVTEIASDYGFGNLAAFPLPTARSLENRPLQRCVGPSDGPKSVTKASGWSRIHKNCIVPLLRPLYPLPETALWLPWSAGS